MGKKTKIVSLRFWIGDKEVTQANWHKFGPEVTEDKLDQIANVIFDHLGDLKCTTHGKKPQVECRGDSIENLNCIVSGCCNQLAMTAVETMKQTSNPHLHFTVANRAGK